MKMAFDPRDESISMLKKRTRMFELLAALRK
jgi:hypothetical protein